MQSKWSNEAATEFVTRYAPQWGEDLALRTYSTRLLGSEERLVLHGGGNTSVKTDFRNLLGRKVPAIFVKASGFDMATIEPEGHSPLDLEFPKQWRSLSEISDQTTADELQTHLLRAHAAAPSIQTLVHAFIPAKFIEHTRADAILALTNQLDSEKLIREALGDHVIVLDYVQPGFKLASCYSW